MGLEVGDRWEHECMSEVTVPKKASWDPQA